MDILVDQGVASSEDLISTNEEIQKLTDLQRIDAEDLAQKAKVKWAIDVDKNSKFSHGILKKKKANGDKGGYERR